MTAAHRIVSVLNLPREVCHFVLGEQHKTSHRMVAGFLIMTGGVLMAKEAHHLPSQALAVFADMLGYGIHALGATPFLEWLMSAEKNVASAVEAAEEVVEAAHE